jgi:hypothetical protein
MKALTVGISSSFAQKNSIFFLLKTKSYLLLIMGSLLIEMKEYRLKKLFHWRQLYAMMKVQFIFIK